MTLIYRLKRLVKADAHALVEGLEDPKWILAQAIRDMETELEKQSALIAEKKARQEQLKKQYETAQKVIGQAESDVDLAMDEKREDIAKALIRKIVLNRKNMEVICEQDNLLQKELETEEKELTQKKQAYDEVCSRAQTVSFPAKNDNIFEESQRLVENETSLEHQVELEFLRRLKNRKGAKDEK